MLTRKIPEGSLDYLEGRRDITEEQFNEWFVDKANPYYTRAIKRRMGVIEILKIAKGNGCECYVTPGNDAYDYGYMIFPDGVVMYVQPGDFWGYDFSISYIPSRETGTGCRCNEESLTTIDWDTLLEQKAEGLRFARKLKAKLYPTVDGWKKNSWNFDKMVQI